MVLWLSFCLLLMLPGSLLLIWLTFQLKSVGWLRNGLGGWRTISWLVKSRRLSRRATRRATGRLIDILQRVAMWSAGWDVRDGRVQYSARESEKGAQRGRLVVRRLRGSQQDKEQSGELIPTLTHLLCTVRQQNWWTDLRFCSHDISFVTFQMLCSLRNQPLNTEFNPPRCYPQQSEMSHYLKVVVSSWTNIIYPWLYVFLWVGYLIISTHS